MTVVRERGIALLGPAPVQVFPAVPRADYVAALMDDFVWARKSITEDPVYGVLNLCRVYWYLLEGRICSKEEGGAWGERTLPAEHRAVVRQTLALYRGHQAALFDPDKLERFASFVEAEVGRLLST